MIKTRFCPSPTGLIHIGNMRTALFNALYVNSALAQKHAAEFLIRIEDTDRARSKAEYTEQLLADLLWLDLKWHDGPGREGDFGPYFQSQREDIYQDYYDKLVTDGHAFLCYCTEAELQLARKAQLNAGQAPRYPGTCRHLTDSQQKKRLEDGIKPCIRLKVDNGEEIRFDDFIQGPKVFKTDDIGDFIIKKADNSASFMFCNAVDDALMRVTHVMRGEDHITNTPRQLYILKLLGLEAPKYGHMPLITGFDGKPLSKRNGSQSISHLREEGYFPLAILNYLARLGHKYKKDDFLSFEELCCDFDISNIGRSAARFDMTQLDYGKRPK